MNALFVTATGTEIGKTYVTVELIRALRARGRNVHALKPIATGFDPQRPEASDTGQLLGALGLPLDDTHLDAVTPWRFAAPLSPDIAAAREHRAIDWAALTAFCRRTLEHPRHDDAQAVTLIEGIGGVMVPLDAHRTVLDLIAELGIRAVLVAGSYLGTLSHTLTAAGMLAARGCALAAVVVDESEDQPLTAEETAEVIRRFVAPAPVIVMPRAAEAGEANTAGAVERLIALLE